MAFATTAPAGSLTVPVIVPRSPCPNVIMAHNAKQAATNTERIYTLPSNSELRYQYPRWQRHSHGHLLTFNLVEHIRFQALRQATEVKFQCDFTKSLYFVNLDSAAYHTTHGWLTCRLTSLAGRIYTGPANENRDAAA